MEKRLYLSKDKKIAGVCGGVAEYFSIDPTLVRLGWILLTLANGAGILAYIIGAVIIPQRPEGLINKQNEENNFEIESTEIDDVQDDDFPNFEKNYDGAPINEEKNQLVLGVALIVLGGFFLTKKVFAWHWISFRYLWPAILIAVGASIIINGKK